MINKFEQLINTHQSALAIETKRFDRLGLLKLIAVLAMIAALVFLFTTQFAPITILATAIIFAICVMLWFAHYKLDKKISYKKALCHIYNQYIMRINGQWVNFPTTGENFATPTHPYALDLDIVGNKSIFQLINTTKTWYGTQALAQDLLNPKYTKDIILQRQAAIAELGQNLDFTTHLQLYLDNPQEITIQQDDLNIHKAIKTLACYLPIFTVPGLFMGFVFNLPPVAVVSTILFGIQGILWVVYGAKLRSYLALTHVYKLQKYAQAFQLIANTKFTAPKLQKIQAQVIEATTAITQFEKIANMCTIISNPFIFIVANLFLLWDFYCAILLARWRKSHGSQVTTALTAVGELESLCAFGVLPHITSTLCMPQIVDQPIIKGNHLAHPLILEAKRKGNPLDFNNQIFIISGSNMSGKTTFMRTIGVNLVLAKAGSYVCAQSLTCGLFNMFTSMRIADDLNQGVSTFYAELKRVKEILTMAKTTPHMLFLIDEIFKGTNSTDRIAGAKAVIGQLEKLGAIGMVTTHDLELCTITSPKLANYSFREHYQEGKIYFNYQLEKGPAKTTNAKYLMQMVGITEKYDILNGDTGGNNGKIIF